MKKHFIRDIVVLTDEEANDQQSPERDIILLEDRSVLIITDEQIRFFERSVKVDDNKPTAYINRPMHEAELKASRAKFLQTQKEAGFNSDIPEGYCMLLNWEIGEQHRDSKLSAICANPDLHSISNAIAETTVNYYGGPGLGVKVTNVRIHNQELSLNNGSYHSFFNCRYSVECPFSEKQQWEHTVMVKATVKKVF